MSDLSEKIKKNQITEVGMLLKELTVNKSQIRVSRQRLEA